MSVAPRRPKGPPLNAMRAFEAAARHKSYVAAAEELSVTPGAISQHVKTLEAWAETPLFHRNAQGVELSQSGRALVAEFTTAFDALAHAARALRDLNPNIGVHIATLPSIAQLWLPKRLARIRKRFPQITISVTAMETSPNLSREMYDLTLFVGPPDRSTNRIYLGEDKIVPVCAPGLVRLFKHKGFEGITLLHDQTWASDWRLWSDVSGVHISDPQAGPEFSLYSLAVEEAKAGAGALMGHLCLIRDQIADGSLVQLSEMTASTGNGLVLEVPDTAQRRPQIDDIIEMLV